jgi:hypothetical protein
MTQTATSLSLRFREVDQKTWPDLERLFEGRGGPKNCWGMIWWAAPKASEDSNSDYGIKNIAA